MIDNISRNNQGRQTRESLLAHPLPRLGHTLSIVRRFHSQAFVALMQCSRLHILKELSCRKFFHTSILILLFLSLCFLNKHNIVILSEYDGLRCQGTVDAETSDR